MDITLSRRVAAVTCWAIAAAAVLLILGFTAAGWTHAETTARVRGFPVMPWHASLDTRLNDTCLYGCLSGAVIAPIVVVLIALGYALWG